MFVINSEVGVFQSTRWKMVRSPALPCCPHDGWSESHKQARDALKAFTSVNALSDHQTTAGINYRYRSKKGNLDLPTFRCGSWKIGSWYLEGL